MKRSKQYDASNFVKNYHWYNKTFKHQLTESKIRHYLNKVDKRLFICISEYPYIDNEHCEFHFGIIMINEDIYNSLSKRQLKRLNNYIILFESQPLSYNIELAKI